MSDDFNNADTEEGLSSFLQTLLTDGRAVVAGETTPQVDDAVLGILAAWEQNARLELPGDAPGFLPAAALWAAKMIQSACRFVVCRDLGAEEITAAFQRKVPAARSPSTDWSVDILFRQLPDVFRLARHLSPTDPLVRELQALAADWPLSSAGVGDLGRLKLDSFIAHAALRQLYADRILAAGDVSRLGDVRVDALLREALGAHPELCPAIARRLFPEEPAPLQPSRTL
jgi:hypothetical protein